MKGPNPFLWREHRNLRVEVDFVIRGARCTAAAFVAYGVLFAEAGAGDAGHHLHQSINCDATPCGHLECSCLLSLSDADNLRVVLVATRNPLNLGAAARAMSNFGLFRLRVVNPCELAFREARSAVGAGHENGRIAFARAGAARRMRAILRILSVNVSGLCILRV